MDFTYAFATSRDLESVRSLLADCKLPGEDIDQHLRYFILARQGEGLAGTVGMELMGDAALFRSLAVRPEFRQRGVGTALSNHMFTRARSSGVRKLYLLTDAAAPFFERFQFAPLPRAKVPEQVRSTAEFRSLCPESAIAMVKEL